MRVILVTLAIIALSGAALASEVTVNDHGLITKVDGIDIDFDKVGVLPYDYTPTVDEMRVINNLLTALPGAKNGPYKVVRSKKIKDCILVIAEQRGVVDGSISFVYSTVSNKILGHFSAGENG